MKRIVLVAALAAVSACSRTETAPVPETEATTAQAAAPAPQTLAADGKGSTGTFQVTTSEGKVMTEEVRPDGTYSTTIDGKVVESGKWVQRAPETYCYTKDEAGAKEVCNVEKVDAKGVWTSVAPDGKTATVVRVEG